MGINWRRVFEIIDECIVLVDEHHVDFNALADARIGEVLDEAVAIAGG